MKVPLRHHDVPAFAACEDRTRAVVQILGATTDATETVRNGKKGTAKSRWAAAVGPPLRRRTSNLTRKSKESEELRDETERLLGENVLRAVDYFSMLLERNDNLPSGIRYLSSTFVNVLEGHLLSTVVRPPNTCTADEYEGRLKQLLHLLRFRTRRTNSICAWGRTGQPDRARYCCTTSGEAHTYQRVAASRHRPCFRIGVCLRWDTAFSEEYEGFGCTIFGVCCCEMGLLNTFLMLHRPSTSHHRHRHPASLRVGFPLHSST